MAMSRKDYVAIATILRNNQASPELIRDLARYLKSDNERFDYERFVLAARKVEQL